MANDLVQPEDLTGFPGAPFADEIVDAAVLDLRNSLGWHVAPERTETLTLDHEGGRDLILPTRNIVTVTAIRDVSGPTPVPITEWREASAGFLVGYWPCGISVVEVDLTHGYATTPADIVAAVAGRCSQLKVDPTLKSVQIDDFQGMLRGDVAAFGITSNVSVAYGLPRDF